MNITFLIGNGFDLRLGMKTKYTDMYSSYINEPSLDDDIRKFKKSLEEDGPKYKTWADFEMGMATYAQVFDNEDSFIKCVRDFKSFMIRYLNEQQEQFKKLYDENNKKEADVIEELERSIYNFYSDESPNVRSEIIKLFIYAGDYKKVEFITFNYTTILDLLVNRLKLFSELGNGKLKIGDINHIHGTLDGDVVLGIDNENQLNNTKFTVNRKVERAFIKPKFNQHYDNSRVASAETSINSSNIICVYGMSLGESDLTWSNQIVKWLLKDQRNKLFYFAYGTKKYEKWNQDAKMDEEEELKDKLLRRICNSESEYEAVFNQVHIPIGADIFGLKDILFNENNIAEIEKELALI